MTPEQKKKHLKLQTDFKYFAKYAPLLIKDKQTNKFTPLVLNKAQRYIHDCMEKQLKETGKVRAWIVKGRKQGASTYVEARFYHKTTRNKGQSAFVVAHDSDTTTKLFRMTKTFHDNVDETLRPTTQYSSRKELVFDELKSEYLIGTAGSKNVGRGGTPNLLHGSEVAFWENPEDIKKGLIQSIPDAPGTEIIYESTANGMDEMFYEGVMDARDGKTDYQVIFVPWYWQDEYTRPVPMSFSLTEYEQKLIDLYGLTNEQLSWRRNKIAELGSEHAFKQEYPCNIDEAFQTSGDSLISSEAVLSARHSNVTAKDSPLVIGVDPARDGDRTVIAFRRGREFPSIQIEEKMNQMRLAGIMANIIDKHKPAKCFFDVAHGYGTIDRLHEMGYKDIVQGVHFGEKPIQDELYFNKRAEIWLELRDWFNGEVSIPDTDEIQKDLLMMPDYIETSSGKKRLVPKETLRKEFKRSPDIGDAMALTFAYPIKSNYNNVELKNKSQGLKTLRRKRK